MEQLKNYMTNNKEYLTIDEIVKMRRALSRLKLEFEKSISKKALNQLKSDYYRKINTFLLDSETLRIDNEKLDFLFEDIIKREGKIHPKTIELSAEMEKNQINVTIERNFETIKYYQDQIEDINPDTVTDVILLPIVDGEVIISEDTTEQELLTKRDISNFILNMISDEIKEFYKASLRKNKIKEEAYFKLNNEFQLPDSNLLIKFDKIYTKIYLKDELVLSFVPSPGITKIHEREILNLAAGSLTSFVENFRIPMQEIFSNTPLEILEEALSRVRSPKENKDLGNFYSKLGVFEKVK